MPPGTLSEHLATVLRSAHRGRALLVELLYFWAFAASLQAALTPDLHDKPAHSSLLSVMGPWPWYIVSTAALALAMLLALAALTNTLRARAVAPGPSSR